MKRLLIIPVMMLAACTGNENLVADISGNNNASIINGQDVVDGEFYAAATVALQGISDESPYCTGTLISKNLVLTAAHCAALLEDIPTKIMFGTKLKSYDDPSLIEIAEATTHQDFGRDPKTHFMLNDLAVIKLARNAPEGFVPVPILDSKDALKVGGKLSLVGWGRTSENTTNDYRPSVLQKTLTPIAEVRDSMVITDQTNSGACNGDSGGPAYIETSKGLVVVGATQGPEPGFKDCHHRGVYTLLVNYKDFLISVAQSMQGEQPQFVSP